MKPKSKKLTPRQRKKEMTGINLEAIHERFAFLEAKYDELLYHVKILVVGLARQKLAKHKKAKK